MPGILGKKIGMTNTFDADGKQLTITVVEVQPNVIVSLREKERDGYEALQLGYNEVKKSKLNKPEYGHLKKNNIKAVSILREFRNYKISDYKPGQTITLEIFQPGDKVVVKGKSKGKGFQGVMRRHGFGGVGTATHGQHNRLRAPGSIGSSSYPSRVFKGMSMAGRMGNSNVTVRNLKVIKIIPEKNFLFLEGSVPGSINSIIEINKK